MASIALAAAIALGFVAVLPTGPAPAPPVEAAVESPPPPVPTEAPEPAPAEPATPGEAMPEVEPYAGKYANDPGFLRRRDRMVQRTPVAVAWIRKRLSLGPGPGPRIRIHFMDTEYRDPEFAAQVNYLVEKGQRVERITVVTELLVADDYDIDRVITHEVAHCWQGHRSVHRMGAMPSWLIEGLADWASDEGDMSRIRNFCSRYLSDDEDVGAVLDRWHADFVRGKATDTAGYAYSHLAIRFLRLLDPPGDGDAFLRRLFLGEWGVPWDEEIRRSTGLAFPAIAARLRPWAESQVRNLLRNREEFQGAAELAKGRQRAEAVERYEKFIAAHPNDALAPRAMLNLAVCLHRAADYEGSLRWLGELRAKWPHAGLTDQVARYLFLNAAERGERERAEALGKVYLRDYSYTSDWILEDVRKRMEGLQR